MVHWTFHDLRRTARSIMSRTNRPGGKLPDEIEADQYRAAGVGDDALRERVVRVHIFNPGSTGIN
jgi:hypothetical protein